MFRRDLLATTAAGATNADHLSMEAALGCLRNAEIAILKFLPQAAAFKTAIARTRNGEAFRSGIFR
jgi:hypothetical protein